MTTDTAPDLGWWVISGRAFLAALRDVQAGESPDIVYAEHVANAQVQRRGEGE